MEVASGEGGAEARQGAGGGDRPVFPLSFRGLHHDPAAIDEGGLDGLGGQDAQQVRRSDSDERGSPPGGLSGWPVRQGRPAALKSR